MALLDFALPIIVALGFSTLWHASLIMSMINNESSTSRNVSLFVAITIFVANVAGLMWIAAASGIA
jgi:heme/copper-type cytochrome/quinol oxidase subunit 4